MTINDITTDLSRCENGEFDQRTFRDRFIDSDNALHYWDNITAMNERQEAKGQAKYGEQLEDNVTLTTAQRIEHAQEEAIDLL